MTKIGFTSYDVLAVGERRRAWMAGYIGDNNKSCENYSDSQMYLPLESDFIGCHCHFDSSTHPLSLISIRHMVIGYERPPAGEEGDGSAVSGGSRHCFKPKGHVQSPLDEGRYKKGGNDERIPSHSFLLSSKAQTNSQN